MGRTGRRQYVNLAQGCWHRGTVAHEIGLSVSLLSRLMTHLFYFRSISNNVGETSPVMVRRRFNFQNWGEGDWAKMSFVQDRSRQMNYAKSRNFSKVFPPRA